jgi:hypothetical protein
MAEQQVVAGERLREHGPAEARPVVGDHCDRCGRFADDEVVGVDDVHPAPVGAEIIEVENPFRLDHRTPQAGERVLTAAGWGDGGGQTVLARVVDNGADPPDPAAGGLETYGTGTDGRIFANERGGVLGSSTYSRVWREARTLAFTPRQVASPLAATAYDLRHAALSTWLNGGVDPTDVAERAGNSVEVLLKRYAKCLDGHRDRNNRLIQAALEIEDEHAASSVL